MNMNDHFSSIKEITRRHFLSQCAGGSGTLALGSLMGCGTGSGKVGAFNPAKPLQIKPPHFPAKAKNVIYMHMAGAPSQLEFFDYKPELAKLDNRDCPPSVLEGKRFAFIRGVPKM